MTGVNRELLESCLRLIGGGGLYLISRERDNLIVGKVGKVVRYSDLIKLVDTGDRLVRIINGEMREVSEVERALYYASSVVSGNYMRVSCSSMELIEAGLVVEEWLGMYG